METPGDLLKLLRGLKHESQVTFGTKVGWGPDIARRLEDGTTKFREKHLEDLVKAGYVVKGSDLYTRLERAMQRQWSNKIPLRVGNSAESQTVVVDLRGRKLTGRLVIELLLAAVVCFGVYRTYRYVVHKTHNFSRAYAERIVGGGMGGAGRGVTSLPCTSAITSISFEPSQEAPVGTKVLIHIKTTSLINPFHQFVHVNVVVLGGGYAWIDNRPEFTCEWDTSKLEPGRYTIMATSIGRIRGAYCPFINKQVTFELTPTPN